MTVSVILILLFSCKYSGLANLDEDVISPSYSAQSDYRCSHTRGCREITAYV